MREQFARGISAKPSICICIDLSPVPLCIHGSWGSRRIFHFRKRLSGTSRRGWKYPRRANKPDKWLGNNIRKRGEERHVAFTHSSKSLCQLVLSPTSRHRFRSVSLTNILFATFENILLQHFVENSVWLSIKFGYRMFKLLYNFGKMKEKLYDLGSFWRVVVYFIRECFLISRSRRTKSGNPTNCHNINIEKSSSWLADLRIEASSLRPSKISRMIFFFVIWLNFEY